MQHSTETKDLAAAMSAAQGAMPVVGFDGQNPFLKNRYATLGALIQAARPILAQNGLSVVQFPTANTAGNIGVETVILHASGQWISNTMELHAHEEKGKSDAQVAGSIVTYLRRYAYAAVLGIVSDEDTDGHQEHAPRPQSAPAARQSPATRPVNPTPPAARMGGSGKAQVPHYEATGLVTGIFAKDGPPRTDQNGNPQAPWHLTAVTLEDGSRFSTFDTTVGDEATALDGHVVKVTWKPGKIDAKTGEPNKDLVSIVGVQHQSAPVDLDSDDSDPFGLE